MGDMIVCARSSYFLQAFRRIGLVPDCGSTWLLPRMIGKARSVELSLMGERLPAEKALEWGLVNRVYDDAVLMEEAMKLAHDLANGPTIALSLIRKLYLGQPGEFLRGAAQPRIRIAAHRGRGGGFQGRRHGVPGKAPRQVQRQMIEDQLGRCVASWYPGGDRRDWCRKTFRRRQPGDLDVRHRASQTAMSARSCAGRRRAMARRRGAPPGLDAEATLMQLAHDAGLPSPRVMHVLTPGGRSRHRLHHAAHRGRNHRAQDLAR